MSHIQWKRICVLSLGVLTGTVVPGVAVAQVTVTAAGSLGPSFDGPSFTHWLEHANQALEIGAHTVGNPATDPTAFVRGTIFTRSEIMNTEQLGFNAWHGNADPVGAFMDELNNELEVQARFLGNGTKIRASNIQFGWHDANGNFGFEGFFSPGFRYRPWRKGIDYGQDGMRGTADDIIYDAGQPAETLVDEIETNIDLYYLAGADTPAPPFGLTHQQQIDWSADFAAANHYDSGTILGGLSLYGDDHTTLLAGIQITFNAVPEPGSFPLLTGLLFSGLMFRRRHRK